MSELMIDELVDPQALEDLKLLGTTLTNIRTTYAEVAKDMVGGLNVKINNLGDLEKFDKMVNDNAQKAKEATDKLKEAVEKQKDALDRTKKSIEENISAMDKENEAKKNSLRLDGESVDVARQILGTRKDNLALVARIDNALSGLKKAQRELNDAEKAGAISSEEALKRRAELIGKERQLRAEKSELQKTMTIEEKMNRSAAGSYENLSQKLELLKRAYKRMSDEMKQTSFGKQMAEDIKELDEKLKDNAADMGEYQRNVGHYENAMTEKLRDILGISEDTGNSLLALGKNGDKGFSMLTTKVRAFGKALLTLLANPAVLSLLGIAGAAVAFKWIYDYNVGLTKATKLTQQFTGATGDMLKSQRNSVQALADVYEQDFQEVLISTNAMAKQFGISFEEAFKYIREGFESGADANGEFLENVKEYPAYFKEAGLSASQFVAITTEANKSGIYSDKAIDTIKEGNLRIRERTKATEDAMKGIGIETEEVYKQLDAGMITTFDIMQMVSTKLNELPESSSEVGTAIADIFGGPGEDAGLQYLKTLKDIETNLDNVKGKAGQMAELQETQLDSEIELQNTISALFDLTGGTFESMMTNAKIFVNNGLVALVKGLINVINYFIEMYNESMVIRAAWEFIIAFFKSGFDFLGNLFNAFIETVRAVGTALKGAFTLDWDLFKKGLTDYAKSFPKIMKEQMKDMKENFKDGIDDMQRQLKPVTIPMDFKLPDDTTAKTNNVRKAVVSATQSGNGEAMQNAVSKLPDATTSATTTLYGVFDEETTKENLRNRLELVKAGSDEELQIRLELMEIERDAELRNTLKTGADRKIIEDKYIKRKEEIMEEHSRIEMENIQNRYSVESVVSDVSFRKQQAILSKQYAEGLISAEDFEKKKRELSTKYAEESSKRTISLLEDQLSVENMSADDREQLEMELARAKADYEKQMADDMIAETERQKRADAEATKQRIDNAAKILDVVSQSIGAIDGLHNALFERKMEKLDAEQERVSEEYDSEIKRIESLAESGAISQEEAESRKRAAQSKTESKEAEIDKKRKKMQYEQAVWNKTTQLSQTAIATARAIMEAYAQNGPIGGSVWAAIIGALGAVQAATIIATPIPQYAKGTDDHPGGLAIVGDGDKKEVVVYDNKAWITPDEPVLVNLPRGAEVYPDAESFDIGDVLSSVSLVPESEAPTVILSNDNKNLERENVKTNYLLDRLIKKFVSYVKNKEFDDYKNTIL